MYEDKAQNCAQYTSDSSWVCPGFVMGVYREMNYPLYFPESDIGGMVGKLTTPDNPAKTKYLEKVGKEYNLIKQSNLLASNHSGEYEHITIAAYETSDGWAYNTFKCSN